MYTLQRLLNLLGVFCASVLFTLLLVEKSSQRAVEDNDFAMSWEDMAAGAAQGTWEEKAWNSP